MAVYPSSAFDRSRARLLQISAVIAVLILAAAAIVYVYYRRQGVEPAPVIQTTTPQPAPLQGTAPQPAALQPVASDTNKSQVALPPATMPAIVAEPNADPNGVVANRITEALAMLNQQPAKVIEARDRLNELLPLCASEPQRVFVKERLSGLAEQWLFSAKIFPEDKLCVGYKVGQGDLLVSIGKQHNVPYEILMQINKIERPEALQADAAIKVVNGPFHARVYRSTFTMDLYLQNTYVKSFSVGLGKPGMETPTGVWRVKSDGKLVKPTWTDPVTGHRYEPEDADYPLGSRWIALDGLEGAAVGRTGFAIHGTKSPEQIGTPGSQGCIRLHNGDAILVYNLLMPGVSLVKVVD
jgi:hypothetical protein